MPVGHTTVNTGLNLVGQYASQPATLDRLRAKRDMRRMQELEEYKAMTARKNAETQRSGMNAAMMAEQRKAADAAQTAAIFASLPPVTAQPHEREFVTQTIARHKAAMNSGNPTVIKQVTESHEALKTYMQTVNPNQEGAYSYGANQQSIRAKNYGAAGASRATANLNNSLVARDLAEPSKPVLQAAEAYVKGNDPNVGNIGSLQGAAGYFKRNYSPDEITERSYYIASEHERLSRINYAATSQGQPPPFPDPMSAAIANYERKYNGGGGSAPPTPASAPSGAPAPNASAPAPGQAMKLRE